METKGTRDTLPAAGARLIPENWALISIQQAHRTISMLAQRKNGVRKQPSNEHPMVDLVYLPDGRKIIVIDTGLSQAWADPAILTNEPT